MTGIIARGNIKRLCITLLLVLMALAVLAGCSQKAELKYTNISSEELSAILKNEKDVYLVDVREPAELVDTGFIPGAVNIPVGKVKEDQSALPETGKLIIYCRTGRRSADIAQFLADKGYSNVYNLKDGIVGWPYEKAEVDDSGKQL